MNEEWLSRRFRSFALVLNQGHSSSITPVAQLVLQPFTIAGLNVPDIDSAVRELNDRAVTVIRYTGMTRDDLGVWTALGGDRVAWSRIPTATRSG